MAKSTSKKPTFRTNEKGERLYSPAEWQEKIQADRDAELASARKNKGKKAVKVGGKTKKKTKK